MYIRNAPGFEGKRSEGYGGLDRIRIKLGNGRLPEFFMNLCSHDPEQAKSLINSTNTSFTSLYILKPTLEQTGLIEGLKPRNRMAVEFIDLVASIHNTGDVGFRQINKNISYDKETHQLMRWILATGAPDDGTDDLFDEILDVAAIALVKEFKDTRNLKNILDLIFHRHRKGTFYHDLVWAFFSCAVPECILLTAKRLYSKRSEDVELARKLLRFIPGIGEDAPVNRHIQFQNCIKWLRENEKFLYYTGDSYQHTDNPCPFAVCLEAKYLQKPASEVLLPDLTLRASNLPDGFNSLSMAEKELLSSFSNSLYKMSRKKWENWINSSLEEQLETAKKARGWNYD